MTDICPNCGEQKDENFSLCPLCIEEDFFGHIFSYSYDGPECSICGDTHTPPFNITSDYLKSPGCNQELMLEKIDSILLMSKSIDDLISQIASGGVIDTESFYEGASDAFMKSANEIQSDLFKLRQKMKSFKRIIKEGK